MPDYHPHISAGFLVGLIVVAFVIRFVLLMVGLLIMVKIQNFDFTWLPLIGSAVLASALDLIPLVGHFIAVPVLYLCVWKCVRCDSYKDATFTVGLSYALVRSSTWILAAYLPSGNLHSLAAHNNFDGDTNFMAIAQTQSTNQLPQMDPPPAEETSKINTDISVSGISRMANNTMVTIQSGRKTYSLSLGEGTTISTDKGSVRVHFLEASANDVTLDVDGQKMKYALK